MMRSLLVRAVCCGFLLGAVVSVGGGSAWASGVPHWNIESIGIPTRFTPGARGVDGYTVIVTNVGDAPTPGKTAPIVISDVLPSGLTIDRDKATEAEVLVNGHRLAGAGGSVLGVFGQDYANRSSLACETASSSLARCVDTNSIPVGGRIIMTVPVEVASDALGSAENSVSVFGGAAESESASEVTPISAAQAPFAVSRFQMSFSNEDGSPDLVAGSHPYSVTTNVEFTSALNQDDEAYPSQAVKDVFVELPSGFTGDATAVPQCTLQQFNTFDDEKRGLAGDSCPLDTQVGVVYLDFLRDGQLSTFSVGIFNLVPPPGEPAEFGFSPIKIPVILGTSVRTGGDLGITVSSRNISEAEPLIGVKTVFWGVPGASGHDDVREECIFFDGESEPGKSCPIGTSPTAFLTMPTSCNGPITTRVKADSWSDPGVFPEAEDSVWPSMIGCQDLLFEPSLSMAPDTTAADTPAGLTTDVRPSLGGLTDPLGKSTANVREAVVKLPEGLVINPGQAAGLQACSLAQAALSTENAPSCPNASRVGTVQITTPLLPDKLEGNVYVLPSNPPHVQLLVAASADGVNVKLVGNVHLDESTGQLTATFSDTPQLPFSDFKLSFSGGAQAALATPTGCGAYTADATFTPWASPFVSDWTTQNAFAIETGPAGGACPQHLGFSPEMIAGSTTDQAGGYTSFSLLLRRADDQQRVAGLQFKTPEGLLGMISKVSLCGEPQASEGACPASSEIGHTVVTAGPGPYPLVVPEAGQPPAPIYLTGSYEDAPYGLSIAVPVIAGPFNLGTIVVRAKIEVDLRTTQLTVTTDPLPLIVDGVPTDLRVINAVIDRPGFMFNPTGCEPQAFSGAAISNEGARVPISSHFQVGSCQALKFKPDFKVSTNAKTSRASGASLTAKIVYPTGPLGDNQASGQSNIQSVKVDLPRQLPSKLSTLQKACTAAVFEANPASCPPASRVGTAKAITPVLPVPLSGPAYFVSHGGEEFPSLIIVLQGYGVTVDLVGSTFISKANITSSTFKQVPDVPIASFELVLPQGKGSALAANLPASAKSSFCGQSLTMPTAFTAQNGAVIHQETKIEVTGCAKAKKTKTARTRSKGTRREHKPSKDGSKER